MKKNRQERTWTYMGLYIPEVDSTKFLGIQLDKNLSWDDHITQLVNKLNRNRYLLNISKEVVI